LALQKRNKLLQEESDKHAHLQSESGGKTYLDIVDMMADYPDKDQKKEMMQAADKSSAIIELADRMFQLYSSGNVEPKKEDAKKEDP